MDKKKIKTEKQRVCRCKTRIPPSWQLNAAQRAFIDDLWQDNVPEAEPPRPVKKDAP